MLDHDKIVSAVNSRAQNKNIWVAYSGGVDSHALLHLLATSASINLAHLHAIHIDHGLQSHSQKWAQHCADIAVELGVDFVFIKVDVKNIDQLGMEAAAREARYSAIKDHLTPDDILLTAQHQDDQAETLLLQLLRGAGPKGLAGMGAELKLGGSNAFRPLLAESQQSILQYAQHHQLQWVEDPSNADTQWNRNYLRHTIWPSILERWPSAAKTLSRSASHCAEASSLLDDLAEKDADELNIDLNSCQLPIDALLSLSSARRNNLLRFVIESAGFPAPSSINLQRIIDELCLADEDSEPLVSWPGVEVRRYQNQLYLMSPLVDHNSQSFQLIKGLHSTELSDGRKLEWQVSQGQGIKASLITEGLSLRYRQGGERIQLSGSDHHKKIKHLFQQWAIQPWLRARIPLLYYGEELIAVVGYCVSDFACEDKGKSGYLPVIKN